MKTTNRKSGIEVNNFIEFKASNLSAKWQCPKKYIVYSYGWYAIYFYDAVKEIWYENKERYSSSTARQMTYARPEHETIKVSNEEMKKLIARVY